MVRRERPRKTAACWAVDMRTRRIQKGISTEQMADRLRCSDAKHVCSIETGYCSITMEKAIRGAYTLEALIVELEGVGGAIVVPYDLEALSKPALRSDNMRPGEAAWVVLEELEEAVASVQNLQAAISGGDRKAVVGIVEQVMCDPVHANHLLMAAVNAMDPTILVEATVNHGRKLVKKGFAPFFMTRPLDAA